MKKALFWDFDGTIVYPNESFLAALKTVLSNAGYEVGEDDIRQFLHSVCTWHLPDISYTDKTGPRWWESLFVCFNTFYERLTIPSALYAQLNASFKSQILGRGSLTLYEDVETVLSECRELGYVNYVLSNNFPELPSVIKSFGLGPYITDYIISAEIGYEKPRAEIFQYALKLAGQPQVSYMIGDNPIADMRGGKAAGMRTILVHGKSALAADYTCAALSEIPRLLV